mmetsp:Transcript_53256/g.79099  ORF Transcript_53256/g.79099 Transcript_53256/m.79099 type:complete len:248 (-) Transcript_53256:627-1370(-)|eukprot:CAMPEP_0195513472 /NCGR_PEP_ID=MMETSP0794_2-20130614/5113_1 /TAXON_ID=515487 /ORGANISM="Stephanopyxis turris, Strain CCMP 815" /LENGTH=247 /DNA_ID=CAMNT_0040641487 /DNA_START=32 /DNA_END=775 /DNA_ORIENTATION=-
MSNKEQKFAAASAASITDSDESIASALQTMQSLIDVFGFDSDLASRAVDAITNKSDVTEAYNWILDQDGVEDKGGPIVPQTNCPHLKEHVKVVPTDIMTFGSKCDYYQSSSSPPVNTTGSRARGKTDKSFVENIFSDGCCKRSPEQQVQWECPSSENWTCLQCNVTRCSRYANGHSIDHWKQTMDDEEKAGSDGGGHCVWISLCDLSVWCHECGAYVRDSSLNDICKRMEDLKFGSDTLAVAAAVDE